MLVKLFLCLAALYVGANAAAAILPPQEKPTKFAHLEGCYVPQLDRVLKYGEEYKPINESCLRYICFSDGQTSIASCGLLYIPPECEIASGNSSVPYPKCCSGIKCKASDGTYSYNFPY